MLLAKVKFRCLRSPQPSGVTTQLFHVCCWALCPSRLVVSFFASVRKVRRERLPLRSWTAHHAGRAAYLRYSMPRGDEYPLVRVGVQKKPDVHFPGTLLDFSGGAHAVRPVSVVGQPIGGERRWLGDPFPRSVSFNTHEREGSNASQHSRHRSPGPTVRASTQSIGANTNQNSAINDRKQVSVGNRQRVRVKRFRRGKISRNSL